MTPTPTGHNGDPSADPGDTLTALREHFRATSGPILATFERLAAQLAASPTSPRAVEVLKRELHRVKGTAESYGFSDAAALAVKLDERIAAWSKDPELDRESRSTIVTHFTSALRLAFRRPLATGQLPPLVATPRRRMLLVALSDRASASLTERASARGYIVDVASAGGALLPERERAPHLAVVARAHAARASRPQPERWIPTLVVDDTADQPVDAEAVFDRADRLLLATTWLRPTVLLLDDDASILEIARYSLGKDLRLVAIDSPLHLFETLEREHPVVLLFEARLPSFDAIAFTRLLRGMLAYRELPILLLGENLDSATSLAAYDAGVDEMLTKPLVPLEIRARVMHRLERLRVDRLTRGLHAMTSIALPARARESVEVHQSLVAGGRRTTSVLVSPRVPDGDTSLAVAWLGESQRLVRAIGATARFAVYRDDLALILVLDAPPPLTRRVLDSLRDNKPGEAPDWDAAVEDGRGPEGFLVTRPSGY